MKFDRFLLRLPLIGRLIRDLHAARMARTLSTMVASRLPLLEGLKLTTDTVHNRVLRARLGRDRRDGADRRQPLGRAAQGRHLPAFARLSRRLRRGVGQARRDAGARRRLSRARVRRLHRRPRLSLLEPAIIIVMGAVVALIVLSILLPILQLDTLGRRI